MFHKKIYFIISIIFLLILLSFAYAISFQKSLSSKVLRLHILANSNSTFDQELKLKVRDDVVAYVTPLLKNSSSLTETKQIIFDNLDNINEVAQNSTLKYANYNTNTVLAISNFPTKHYEKISFPAGDYEALKITIGEGKGNNWWCVMFPPLCFTNSSAGEFDDNELKDSLSTEEYYLVNNYEKPEVKVKFRILEMLNK